MARPSRQWLRRAALKGFERRACAALGFDRSSTCCRGGRGDDDGLRTLASERRRFGWRRFMVLIARKGLAANHGKLRRVDNEERL